MIEESGIPARIATGPLNLKKRDSFWRVDPQDASQRRARKSGHVPPTMARYSFLQEPSELWSCAAAFREWLGVAQNKVY
jgi:hypothetical protein